jgi:hypothetical protein
MQNKIIVLILMAFLTAGAVSAQAENAPAQQKAQTPPTNMNDAALASYISGRLAPLLKDSGYIVSQNCDSSGCAVVVQ